MVERETLKELEDFAVRFAGAMTGAAEAAATEIIYRTHPELAGKFPYTQIIPQLCPNDNLIVAGLSIPPWVIGYLVEEDAEKKGDTKTKTIGENLRKFGEGDAIYSWCMVLHHTLIRNVPQTWAIEARAGQSSQRPSGQPGAGRPPAQAVVVKL